MLTSLACQVNERNSQSRTAQLDTYGVNWEKGPNGFHPNSDINETRPRHLPRRCDYCGHGGQNQSGDLHKHWQLHPLDV
jgi:hypothetical protein